MMLELRMFPTEIGIFEVPDADAINNELKNVYKDVEPRNSISFYSVKTKNYDLWKDRAKVPALEKLYGHFLTNAKQYISTFHKVERPRIYMAHGWYNMYSSDMRRQPYHHHYIPNETTLVGVYYIDVIEDDPNKGTLNFIDPRWHYIMKDDESKQHIHRLHVQNGQMVFFPGWLYHTFEETERQYNDPRVSIAVNIRISDL